MLERTHIPEAPWWVVQAVDKKKARLNCISHLLGQMPYHEVGASAGRAAARACAMTTTCAIRCRPACTCRRGTDPFLSLPVAGRGRSCYRIRNDGPPFPHPPDARLPAQPEGLDQGRAGQRQAHRPAGERCCGAAAEAAAGGGDWIAGAALGPAGAAGLPPLPAARTSAAAGREAALDGHAARLRPDRARIRDRHPHEPGGGPRALPGPLPGAGPPGQCAGLLELVRPPLWQGRCRGRRP